MPRIHAHSKATAWVPDWRTDINRGDYTHQKRRQQAERTRIAAIRKYPPGCVVAVTWRMTEGGRIVKLGIFVGVVPWAADKSIWVATVTLDEGPTIRVDAMRLTRRKSGTLPT